MSLDKALENAAERLSKGESHTEVARSLVQEHNLNARDLATVLKQTLNKADGSGGKKRKKSVAMSVQSSPSDTYVEDATYLASLLVSAIPGVTPTDVATALKDPRNYPNLTAYQMGEVLKSDGVFPSITSTDMQTALLAAGYPSTDVDAAIAELYSVTPPVLVTYRRMGPAGQAGQMPFDDNSYAIAGQPITQLIVRKRIIPDPDMWNRCRLAWEMCHSGASYGEIHTATCLFKNINGYDTFSPTLSTPAIFITAARYTKILFRHSSPKHGLTWYRKNVQNGLKNEMEGRWIVWWNRAV